MRKYYSNKEQFGFLFKTANIFNVLMELTMAVSDILRAKGLTRWKSILKNEMH